MFFLTIEELLGDVRRDRRAEIAERREIYARYRSLDIPETWQGNPTAVPLKREVDGGEERVTVVRGMGVSASAVTGEVKLVHDADSDKAGEAGWRDMKGSLGLGPAWPGQQTPRQPTEGPTQTSDAAHILISLLRGMALHVPQPPLQYLLG